MNRDRVKQITMAFMLSAGGVVPKMGQLRPLIGGP